MKLEMTPSAWLAFAAGAGLWLFSIILTRDAASRRNWTWTAIPTSFFGLTWIVFGITFIFRFIVLAYDPELFQTTQFPLWRIPTTDLTWSWIVLTLFWLAFISGYFLMTRLSLNLSTMLGKLDLLATSSNLLMLDVLVFCCSCLVILSGWGLIPNALCTPLAILGGFYVIAATAVWFDYFQGQPLGQRNFLYLIPGIFIYLFSPFRILIFAVVLCVLVPALKTRRWVSFKSFFLTMLALLLLTTIINDYRRAKMKAEFYNQQAPNLTDETWGSKEHHKKAAWVRLINRFHGFDSMALTIHFVPSFFPHSHLNIFANLIWRVIPRAITDKKADTHRGRKFSATIWAMGERGLIKRQESNISMTMCADLYQINGIPLVVVGAAFYGLLAGLLESWQRRRGLLTSCILLAVFGLPTALGIEQEFDFATATLIQIIIGLLFFLFLLPTSGQNHIPGKTTADKVSTRTE